MKRENWIAGNYSERPARADGTCFYCGVKLGEEHNKDCVIRSRTIKVKFSVDMVVSVPEFWDEHTYNFSRNEGSYCLDNVIDDLIFRSKEKGCLCDVAKLEYIGEATEQDEIDWGVTFVKDLES